MNSQRRSHRMRTRAIHAGERPDPITGAAAPNLVMSTTFMTEDAATGFSAHSLADDAPYLYTRWSNPTVRQLEMKLADLENGEDAVAFGSGMAAATGLFLSVLKAGDHVVVSDVSYAGVAELVRDSLPQLGIRVSTVDLADLDELQRAMLPTTRLVYAETPVNPLLRLADIQAIADIAHAAGAEVAVDSTLATPLATQPLDLGADYVLHSLTKYIGGHGDALGGAIVGGRERLAQMRQAAVIHFGGVLSPFNAWLILRGVATLPLRMAAHAESAGRVARFLEQHAGVVRVIYPGLPSHPQYELACRQMTNFSGMLTFQVADGPALAHRLPERLDVFHYAVSLGHHRSLIFYLSTDELQKTSFRLDAEHLTRYRLFAGNGIFRVSIGLEDPDDLCDDLDRALG